MCEPGAPRAEDASGREPPRRRARRTRTRVTSAGGEPGDGGREPRGDPRGRGAGDGGGAGVRGAHRAGLADSDERACGEAARRRRPEHPPPELLLAARVPAMETLNGPAAGGAPDAKPQPPGQHHRHHYLHPLAERRRLHRAPSPARPFLKDLHGRPAAPGPAAPSSGRAPAPAAPRSPSLAGKAPPSPGPPAAPGRVSRRSGGAPGAKDKPPPGAGARAAGGAKAAPGPRKAARAAPAEPLPRVGKPPLGAEPLPAAAKGRKAKRGSGVVPARASGPRVPIVPVPAVILAVTPAAGSPAPGSRISHTDSSSDLSDCPSDPLSDEQRLIPAASSDAESGTGSSDREPLRGAPTTSPAARGAPTGSPEPFPLLAAPPAACLGGRSSPSGVPAGSPGPGVAEDAGGCAPPERTVPGNPKEHGPGEQPRLVPAAAAEELLREMEELRSENDYLKVRSPPRRRWPGGDPTSGCGLEPASPASRSRKRFLLLSFTFLPPAHTGRWELEPKLLEGAARPVGPGCFPPT